MDNKPELVQYCEYLFMSNPIVKEMEKTKAFEYYETKIQALKEYGGIMEKGSFVGIKDLNGTWLIQNNTKDW